MIPNEFELKDPTPDELGALIANLRSTKGITQKQLAQAAGVSRSAIANIETGTNYPVFNNLIKIAESLDVNIIISFS